MYSFNFIDFEMV